jgi:hypothetical protein
MVRFRSFLTALSHANLVQSTLKTITSTTRQPSIRQMLSMRLLFYRVEVALHVP